MVEISMGMAFELYENAHAIIFAEFGADPREGNLVYRPSLCWGYKDTDAGINMFYDEDDWKATVHSVYVGEYESKNGEHTMITINVEMCVPQFIIYETRFKND